VQKYNETAHMLRLSHTIEQAVEEGSPIPLRFIVDPLTAALEWK